MTNQEVYLAEIVAYDPGIPGTKTLRYATVGMALRPTETPANAYYEERIAQPAWLNRDMFDTLTTAGRSRTGYGDLVLRNKNGELDSLRDLGFDGRALVIRRGTVGAAYPAGFPILFQGTIETLIRDQDTLTFKIKDRQAELDVPLQTTKYAGTNVLPAGLEGTSDIQGKPKPLVFGQVKNVQPPFVNTAKLIAQVNDGAIASVDGVYDNGIALGGTQYLAAGGGAVSTPAGSADGKTWAKSLSNPLPSSSVTCGCPGASGVMVLGSVNNIFYSTNGGATWSTATLGANTVLNAIAYNGSLYVAVGYNSSTSNAEIWTSSNLSSWTSRTPTGFGAVPARSVAWDATNSQWVVGGDVGKLSTGNAAGTTWTAQTTGFLGTIWAIVPMASLIVAASSGGEIRTSPTGATWTARTVPWSGSPQILTGCFGNGVAILAGDSGTMASSTDGINWTLRASRFATSDSIVASMYAGGVFVIGGDNGSIAWSPEGVNWTLVSAGYAVGSYKIQALTYATGLSAGTYANLTDLQDDTKAPLPGSYKVYLAGGYIRLGVLPAGTLTADVTQGATAADRTTAQVWKAILTKAGKSSGDWSATDITALDAANSAVIGMWIDGEVSASQALDQAAASILASWGADRLGVYRIRQFAAPSGSPAAVFAKDIRGIANAIPLKSQLQQVQSQDDTKGIPVNRCLIRYDRNYTVQDQPAANVTAARREFLSYDFRTVSYSDASVLTKHLLSPQTDEFSCLVNASDAQAEATRRLAVRGERDIFQFMVQLTDTTLALDLNDVVTLYHPRYGLSGGKLFRIIGVRMDAMTRYITFTVWG